jgi:hypothetical protein
VTVQIKASFKKDNRHLDGLDAVRKDLVADQVTPRVVIAVLEVTDVNHNVLEGTDTPKLRVRSIEVMTGRRAITASGLLEEAYAERTGGNTPPATLFDAVEPEQDPTAGPWEGDADWQGEEGTK